ncbi:MAG: hypothetical protein AB1643_01185 [Patescibacteria group bacterium]
MDDKNKYRLFLLFSLVFIFFLHAVATYFYLYWILWYLDDLLHFLGGVWLGLFASWLLFLSGKINIQTSNFFIIIIILGISALIGLLWEFSEFLLDKLLSIINIGRVHFFQPSIEDTMIDLFSDLLGGIVAAMFFLKNKRRYGQQP